MSILYPNNIVLASVYIDKDMYCYTPVEVTVTLSIERIAYIEPITANPMIPYSIKSLACCSFLGSSPTPIIFDARPHKNASTAIAAIMNMIPCTKSPIPPTNVAKFF